MSVSRLFSAGLILFISLWVSAHAADPVRVEALVSSNRVTLDEIITLQVQVVAESDNITRPDMSGLSGFDPAYQGASQATSTMLSTVNGKTEMVTERKIVYNYQLLPLQEGKLTIPALSVEVDGRSYKTKPIAIIVAKSNADNKAGATKIQSILRYNLPRKEVYLGETIPIELVWYYRNGVKVDDVEMPILNNSHFIVSKASVPKNNELERDQQLVDTMFNGGKYWALQSEGIIDGVAYNTLTLKWYLSPKEVGKLEIDPARIVASFLVGYRENSMFAGMPKGFSGMFGNDPFMQMREPVYKQAVTRSKPVTLEVKPLPLEGKPASFSGVVSSIELRAETDTTEAAVGEPIKVDLLVRGNDNIYNMQLPDFNEQPDIRGKFKVSIDENEDTSFKNLRMFALTLRALKPGITEIPPLKVAYYDLEQKSYAEAETAALPLQVKAAKIVTATDIESAAEPASKTVTAREENKEGIYANVVGEQVLVNQQLSIGEYLGENKVFFTVFPGCYFALLLGQLVLQGRGKNAAGRAASRALKVFTARLGDLRKGEVDAEALTRVMLEYFRTKLAIEQEGLTLSEILPQLAENPKVSEAILENLKKIIDYCEACCYTGGAPQVMSQKFIDCVEAVITKIDSEMGRRG